MSQPEPFGKFLLLGQVAVGGMAEIYKAKYADPSISTDEIALKRVLPSYTEDESFITMFKDEGNIAIRLKHPNIVNIFEVGEINGDWYIAMEYIRGNDIRILDDACQKYSRCFTFTQIARILCDTAKALDYAHNAAADDGTPLGIIHRDCTPHNIMVSQTGQVKLMDFGIAKAASRATKTRVGTVKGKSSYMSPEQARGKSLDGRSDMFTIGTVGWELLTRYRLFKANSDFDILTKVLKLPIIHPCDLDDNIPRELGDIIMKTLERDRDLRYPNCGVLAKVLETWIQANGDGSDKNLGDAVLALENKKGHSYMELPEYHRGNSKYNYVDGEFVPVSSTMAPVFTPDADLGGPTEAVVRPSMQQLQAFEQQRQSGQANALSPQVPQPQYPMPAPGSDASAPSARVPLLYFILYTIFGLITILCIIGAISIKSSDLPTAEDFSLPNAFITLKTNIPDEGAEVYLDNTLIKQEDGSNSLTPIYTYKTRIGDTLKLSFKKKDYVTAEIEKNIYLLNEQLTIDMVSVADKEGVIPEFMIKTSPSGMLVKVNGEDKGVSPVKLENVKFGTEINIEAASEDNSYIPSSRTVKTSKTGVREVELILAQADQPSNKPKDNKTAAKDKKPSNTPAKPKASGDGTLTAKIVPWGRLHIDGQVRDLSKPIKLSPGKHKLTFEHPPKRLKVNKDITIKSGQTVKIGYNFDKNSWI